MNLTTTKERVLEAAGRCSQARETLKVLFPDIFKEETEILSLGEYPNNAEICKINNDTEAIQIAAEAVPEEFRGKCFVLSSEYIWNIVDNSNPYYTKLLIPTKKWWR